MVESTTASPGLFRRLWRGGASDKVKTIRLGLNAYGKLPIYKDFISTGLTDPAAREFRTWLDRGFSHRWSTDENFRDTEIASQSFLFRLADGKGWVAGSVWGSSDEGGLRRFPFTLFVSFASGQASDPLVALGYLDLLEAHCRDLRERFGPGGSLTALYQTYRGASFECPLKSKEQTRREIRASDPAVALSEFAGSLLGEDSASTWSVFLTDLREACVSEDVGAVRIPLGGALTRIRELQFWLLWMAQQDARRVRPVVGVLFPNGTGPGRATFLFRDLQADDIFFLHSARVGGVGVRELPREVSGPSGATTEEAPPSNDAPSESAAPVVGAAPERTTPEVISLDATPDSPPGVAKAIETPSRDPASFSEASTNDARSGPIESTTAASGPSPFESSAELEPDIPFMEAETAAPDVAASEEPLQLDAHGHPRLTQAPFSLSSTRVSGATEIIPDGLDSTVPEAATPALASSSEVATGDALVPSSDRTNAFDETEPYLAIDASPPSPSLPAKVESDQRAMDPVEVVPPAAPPAAPTPEPAPNATAVNRETSPPPAPPGWNQPVFALIEG